MLERLVKEFQNAWAILQNKFYKSIFSYFISACYGR